MSYARAALIVSAILAGVFLACLAIVLLYGCAATMPEEPSITVTIAASARDR